MWVTVSRRGRDRRGAARARVHLLHAFPDSSLLRMASYFRLSVNPNKPCRRGSFSIAADTQVRTGAVAQHIGRKTFPRGRVDAWRPSRGRWHHPVPSWLRHGGWGCGGPRIKPYRPPARERSRALIRSIGLSAGRAAAWPIWWLGKRGLAVPLLSKRSDHSLKLSPWRVRFSPSGLASLLSNRMRENKCTGGPLPPSPTALHCCT